MKKEEQIQENKMAKIANFILKILINKYIEYIYLINNVDI